MKFVVTMITMVLILSYFSNPLLVGRNGNGTDVNAQSMTLWLSEMSPVEAVKPTKTEFGIVFRDGAKNLSEGSWSIEQNLLINFL